MALRRIEAAIALVAISVVTTPLFGVELALVYAVMIALPVLSHGPAGAWAGAVSALAGSTVATIGALVLAGTPSFIAPITAAEHQVGTPTDIMTTFGPFVLFCCVGLGLAWLAFIRDGGPGYGWARVSGYIAGGDLRRLLGRRVKDAATVARAAVEAPANAVSAAIDAIRPPALEIAHLPRLWLADAARFEPRLFATRSPSMVLARRRISEHVVFRDAVVRRDNLPRLAQVPPPAAPSPLPGASAPPAVGIVADDPVASALDALSLSASPFGGAAGQKEEKTPVDIMDQSLQFDLTPPRTGSAPTLIPPPATAPAPAAVPLPAASASAAEQPAPTPPAPGGSGAAAGQEEGAGPGAPGWSEADLARLADILAARVSATVQGELPSAIAGAMESNSVRSAMFDAVRDAAPSDGTAALRDDLQAAIKRIGSGAGYQAIEGLPLHQRVILDQEQLRLQIGRVLPDIRNIPSVARTGQASFKRVSARGTPGALPYYVEIEPKVGGKGLFAFTRIIAAGVQYQVNVHDIALADGGLTLGDQLAHSAGEMAGLAHRVAGAGGEPVELQASLLGTVPGVPGSIMLGAWTIRDDAAWGIPAPALRCLMIHLDGAASIWGDDAFYAEDSSRGSWFAAEPTCIAWGVGNRDTQSIVVVTNDLSTLIQPMFIWSHRNGLGDDPSANMRAFFAQASTGKAA